MRLRNIIIIETYSLVMKMCIEKRKLVEEEINRLIQEMKKFPDIGLFTKNLWKDFQDIFVAQKNGNLIGVCTIVDLGTWIKIGPLIVLSKFQGKGYGKLLFTHVMNTYKKKNLYIGSSHPRIWTIVEKRGFQRVGNFFSLPFVIQRYLIMYFFKRFNSDFLFDTLRKKLISKRGPYRYYYLSTGNISSLSHYSFFH